MRYKLSVALVGATLIAVVAGCAPDSVGPHAIAKNKLWGRGERGQYECLRTLWDHESGWNIYATNPSSGAYGIPQSLPAEKMAAAGPDWRTNPATQIEWGLDYIDARYGGPCNALSHWYANNWY